MKRIFKILHEENPPIAGKIVGVSGNRKALMKGVRFIDEDLNRTWTVENIRSEEIDSHEKQEMFGIIKVLESYPEKYFTKRYFLDCHTTSAASEPYISVQVVNDNDAWAHKFPTYIIRGFSDIVLGCIDHYESRIGMTGFVFEGGQHESKVSEINHEGMIWHTIHHALGLDFSALKKYPESARILEEKRKKRKTFEIEYRHGLSEGDEFQMEPNFSNFQRIAKGEKLAMHNGEPINSKWDSYIFMPLYQSQGNDGFFVVREIGAPA